AKICAIHAIESVLKPAWTGLMEVVGSECCAQRAASIPSCRLDPKPLELTVAQHFAVRHTVERHAAGKTQIFGPRLGRDRSRKPQHDLLGHRLDRGGKIHVVLVESALGPTRR